MRSEVWRLAAAARNRSLERSGVPPARHYDLAARSSLHGSGGNAGEGSAAPDPKSPRWSAERRASRSQGTQAPRRVPGLPRHGGPTGCRCTRASVGAPPPLIGVANRQSEWGVASKKEGGERRNERKSFRRVG